MAAAQTSARVLSPLVELCRDHHCSSSKRSDRGLVGVLVPGEEPPLERVPLLVGAAGRGGVRPLELLVALVVGGARGEVRAVRRLDHAVDHHPADEQPLHGGVDGQSRGVDDLLAGEEGAVGGHAEEVVEVRVGAEVRRVAVAVGTVEVHQRDVEPEGGDGDELLGHAVGAVVRAGDGADVGVVDQYVRPETGAHRQEGQPLRGGAQPGLEHALVELDDLRDGAGLPRPLEVRLERDRVQRDERVDQPADLAGPGQQAHVRAAPAHDREVRQVGAQDRADQRHRLAARPPAADADGHAVAQLGHDLVDAHPLVAGGAVHRSSVPRVWSSVGRACRDPLSVPANSSRSSSETPARLSSKVNPCSNR